MPTFRTKNKEEYPKFSTKNCLFTAINKLRILHRHANEMQFVSAAALTFDLKDILGKRRFVFCERGGNRRLHDVSTDSRL